MIIVNVLGYKDEKSLTRILSMNISNLLRSLDLNPFPPGPKKQHI